MLSKVLLALAFASTALATVFITAPVNGPTWTAGQQATIEWKDDGNAPTLAQFGPSKIGIWVGNTKQQTEVQHLSDSTDVSLNTSFTFVPSATIGPNSDQYFIRFDSVSLKDSVNPQNPAQSFSNRFTLTGMTGTFSDVISSEIAGQSTAPFQSSATSSSVSSGTSTPPASATHSTSSTKASTTSSGVPSPSKTSSATGHAAPNFLHVGWTGALLSAVAAMAVF